MATSSVAAPSLYSYVMDKKESLLIKDLGPINEVHLEDIRPFTIIIGPSGSGKSTIMKVLSLFRWLYKREHIRAYLRLSKITKTPFKFVFKSLIASSGLSSYLKRTTEIVYCKDGFTLKYQGGKLHSLATNQIKAEELHLEKVCFISEARSSLASLMEERIKLKEKGSYYLQETIDAIDLAMRTMGEYQSAFFDLRFTRTKTATGFRYLIKGDDFELPLYGASSGTQSSIPLMAVCQYFSRHFDLTKAYNDSIFGFLKDSDRLKDFKPIENIGNIKSKRVSLHIEEPELSLSPEKQRAMLNELVATCFSERQSKEDYSLSVMMTTHSPYIVNQINLLVKAAQVGQTIEGAALPYEDIEVYRLNAKGQLYSLKALNTEFIDTMSLSDDINEIYDEYDRLGRNPL